MNIILKYVNGAELRMEVSGPVPDVLTMGATMRHDFGRGGEGLETMTISFYFELADELPSGAVLYKEISREQVMRIVRGEA